MAYEEIYTKPSTGIPKSDLASAVQTSLGKADTALQSHQDISGKQDKTTAVTHTASTAAGSATQPVYVNASGVATATTYSLGKSVPSDAKFTDTTYSAATTSAAGLMSAADKTKLDKTVTTNDFLAISESMVTVATDATKGVSPYNTSYGYTNITLNDYADSDLKEGMVIIPIINTTMVVASANRNVRIRFGSSGAWKPVMATTGILSGYSYFAKSHFRFYQYTTKYISTGAWHLLTDSNSTYSTYSLGIGYGTCATAEATTAKVVTHASYTLVAGGINAVKFTYAVPASSTLNVNSKGAKSIFYKGSAITAGVIKAGDLALFIYDGTNYQLLSIDRSAKYEEATTSAAGLMSAADKTKLDGIASGANAYSLPTASASTLGGVKVGTNLSISNGVLSATNTTYSNFVKSGSTAAAGLVPAPSTTAGTTKYLREDGTWQVPPDNNTTYSAATTSANGLMTAAMVTKLNGIATGATALSIGTTATTAAAGNHSHSNYVTKGSTNNVLATATVS